jgi:hypothetical protein
MSTPKGPAVVSHVGQGAYTEAWREDFAINDTSLAPQYYGEVIQPYGGLTFWDAQMAAGRTIDISTREMTVLTKGYFLDTIDVKTQIEAAGANASLTLLSTKNILRVGFVVHIPAKYMTSAEIPQSYRCTVKTYDTDHWVHTLVPLLAGQQLAVAIPVTQELVVGGSMFAAGTQQPAGLIDQFYSQKYNTRIMKETINYEGGQGALKELDAIASLGNLKARSRLDAQLRLRYQLSDAALMGYKITHSGGWTQANEQGEANVVLSNNGLLPTMIAESMKQYYTGSFTEDNFDIIPFLLASQGVAGQSGMFLIGNELGLGVENATLNMVKEYSGGTDLYTKMQGIGFGVSQITKNGFTTRIVRIPEFSNPKLYGAAGYNFESLGMIFPDAKVTATINQGLPNGSMLASKTASLSNFTLGFLNYGGENRRLITGDKAGVNGWGIPFSSDWDNSSEYTLTEAMNIFVNMNQTILVLRTDV